jgi:hypothetical protein
LRNSWIASVVLLATASVAPAITIGFSGNFAQDDGVVLFQYTIQNSGVVTIETTSFAGGGFSPILTVFDSSGMFLFENVGYSNTPSGDAAVPSWPALGGASYIVALSQYDNQANASQTFGNLSEGFLRQGQGNFTAAPPFNDVPGGSFLLPGPEQRTSAWAVNFTSADPTLQASQIPEPATGALVAIGAAMFYGLARARRRKKQFKPTN